MDEGVGPRRARKDARQLRPRRLGGQLPRRDRRGVFQIPAIGFPNAVHQGNPRAPAERAELSDIQQLARRPVRLRVVIDELPAPADDARNERCQLGDRKVLARADIDRPLARVMLREKNRCVGQIVDMQEFAPWLARAPDRHLGTPLLLRIMEFRQECRQHMARGQVEIVIGTVEVGRHRRNEVAAILPPVSVAQLHARDFRHRVPLVRRLERSGQQRVLDDRLAREFRVDAGRPQEQQLGDAGAPRAFDQVRLDREVLIEEIRRADAVR